MSPDTSRKAVFVTHEDMKSCLLMAPILGFPTETDQFVLGR